MTYLHNQVEGQRAALVSLKAQNASLEAIQKLILAQLALLTQNHQPPPPIVPQAPPPPHYQQRTTINDPNSQAFYGMPSQFDNDEEVRAVSVNEEVEDLLEDHS